MSLNAVDKKAIKDFLPYWGVKEDEAVAEYTKAKAKVIEQYGEEDEKKTAARAVQVASVIIRPKSYNIGSGKPYKAIMLASTRARDMWGRQRDLQMQKYEELKKAGKEKKAFADQIVKLDESTGQIIPLCPLTKADGTRSKVGGEPIPSPDESLIQQVIGITYIEEKGSLKPIGFKGTTRGTTCVNSGFDSDAIYEFIGSGEIDKKSGLLVMNINSPMKKVDDAYLTEGKNKIGIHKMVKKMFGDIVIDQPALASFMKLDKVPDKFRDFIIVEDALVPFYNPKPNSKGNIRLQLENRIDIDNPPSADAQSTMGLADAKKVKLNFGQGSVVMAIGDAWITKGDDTRIVMNISSIIPYPDDIVEVAPEETKDMPAEEVDEAVDTPENTEITSEEKVEESTEADDENPWA